MKNTFNITNVTSYQGVAFLRVKETLKKAPRVMNQGPSIFTNIEGQYGWQGITFFMFLLRSTF